MSRLLTLALSETRNSNNENGYEVIAWNIDESKWVLIRRLPMRQFKVGKDIIWDVFSITEAKLEIDYSDSRDEVFNIDYSLQPRMIDRISDNNKKIEILEKLSVNNVRQDIYKKGHNVGLVKPQKLDDIYFNKKRDGSDDILFNWESRIIFSDSNELWSWSNGGVPCKDMRWKKYWHQLRLERQHKFDDKVIKWRDYMCNSYTYFLIEIYPPLNVGSSARGCFNDNSRKYFSVAGIHSIKI